MQDVTARRRHHQSGVECPPGGMRTRVDVRTCFIWGCSDGAAAGAGADTSAAGAGADSSATGAGADTSAAGAGAGTSTQTGAGSAEFSIGAGAAHSTAGAGAGSAGGAGEETKHKRQTTPPELRCTPKNTAPIQELNIQSCVWESCRCPLTRKLRRRA